MNTAQNQGSKRVCSLTAVIALMLALVVFMVTGCKNVEAEPSTNPTTEPVQTEAVLDTDVKTLEQLKQLLESQEDLTITLNTDLEVDSAIQVVGNKTVTGTGKLTAALGTRDNYAIFDVRGDAVLHVEGISMDGNASADGIAVQLGGSASIKNVTIMWPYQYGVAAYGDAVLEDVTVDNAPTAAVLASTGKVTVDGGSFTNSHSLIMYVEKTGELTLTGDSVLTGSGKHGITNRGKLTVESGSITGCAQYAIVNYGTLNMAYNGTDAEGAIELAGNTKGAIYNYGNGVVDAKDLYIHDNERSAVSNNGNMTLADSVITASGTNGIYNAAVFYGDNLTVTDSGNCGVYNINPGDLTLTNSDVEDSTKRGVHNKGGVVELDTVTVTNSGTHGVANTVDDYSNPGTLTARSITVSGAKTNVYNEGKGVTTTVIGSTLKKSQRTNVVVTYGTMTLNSTKVLGSKTNGTYAVQIGEEGKCTITGSTVITGSASRGVTNHGTLTMSGGQIYGNNGHASGGGVFTDGVFYFSGGSIHDNTAASAGGGISVGYSSDDPNLVGKLYMTGGKIYNNTAATNGGGVYVSKGTSYDGGDIVYCYASITGGQIYENTANLGSAIMYSSSGELGGSLAIGSESDIRLNTGVVLKVSELTAHSASDPVRISVSGSAGTVIMEAADVATAEKVLSSITSVTPTTGFERSGKKIVLNAGQYVAVSGPDMTGAEMVEVSSFQQLKNAVEGVVSGKKLVVKITGNITMESTITVPGGATVMITDNGSAVTLLRGAAMTAGEFFSIPSSGTLSLEGTAAGNLTLDGNNANVTVTAADSSLLSNKGQLYVATVTLQNNYASADQLEGCYGGLIYAPSGIVNVTDSLLTGGNATNGGAIFVSGAQVTLTNTVVSGNSAGASGGAIRYQGGLLVIEGGSFTENVGASGGAIAVDKAMTLRIADTVFEKNHTSEGHGGAVYLTSESVLEASGVTFKANYTDGNGSYYGGALGLNTESVAKLDSCVFDGNYCDHEGNNNGGAIYAGNASKVDVTGTSQFKGNYVTGNGGAIYGNNGAEVTVGENTTFTGNTAKNGGVAYATGYTLSISGAVITENSATGNGGVIYATSGAEVTLTDSECTKNSANAGGVAYVDGGNLTVEGSVFENNACATSGGVFHAPAENNETTVIAVTDSAFANNTAATYGGVINTGSGCEISFTDCAFNGNTAKASNNANTLMVSTGGVISVKNVTITPADASVGDVRVQNNSTVNVAGKCELGIVKYNTNTCKIHVTEALASGSAMTILPAGYTEGDVVVTGASETLLQGAVRYIGIVPNGVDKWSVGADGKLVDNSFVASIGDQTYKTVEEAVAAAQSGNTIVLYKDASAGSALTIPAGVTLDGDGKKLTADLILAAGAKLKDIDVTGNVTVQGDTDLTTAAVSGGVTVAENVEITVGGDFDAASIDLAAGATIAIDSALGSDTSIALELAVETVDTVILTGDTQLLKTEYTKFQVTLSDGTLCLGASGKIEEVPFQAIIEGKDAYDTLEAAIAAAAAGDTIKITNDCTVETELTIDKKLTITSATSTTCVIYRGSADQAVFSVTSAGELILTNVNMDGNGTTLSATKAMIYNDGGNVTVSNGAFSNNTTTESSGLHGVIYNNGGSVTVENCTFTGNKAYTGGAIFSNDGSVIVSGSTFTGNQATGGGGGALYAGSGASIQVTGSSFSTNAANSYGGVINVANSGSSASFTDCTFSGNTAKTSNNANTLMASTGTTISVKNVAITPAAASTGDVRLQNNCTLNVAGQCDLGIVWYNNNSCKIHATEAMSQGSAIRIKPAAYTEDAVLVTGASAQLLEGALRYISVIADGEDLWELDTLGALHKLTFVASVGGQNYESFEQAMAAAQSGSTVTLLANVSAETLTVPAGVTLDGDGNRITGDVTVAGTVTDLEIAGDATVNAGAVLTGVTVTGNAAMGGTATLSDLAVQGDVTLSADADLTGVAVTGKVVVPAGVTVSVGGSFDAGSVELAAGAAIQVKSALASGASIDVVSAVTTEGTVILTGEAALLNTEYTKFQVALTDANLTLAASGKIEEIPFQAAIVGKGTYDTLEAAITAAAAGDTIQINKNYTVNAQIEIGKELTITSAGDACVIYRGSTAGAVFSVTADGDLTLTKLTVDGKNTAADDALINNEGGFTLSSNATLRNGNSSSNAGGLDNQAGATAVVSGTITGCTGKNGGAIRNFKASGSLARAKLTISDGAVLSRNTSNGTGGALHQGGELTLGAATFSENHAVNHGGAINFTSDGNGYVTVNGTIFTGNYTDATYGGAIYVSGSAEVTLENVQITGKGETATATSGGAIGVGGTLTLTGANTSITNCKATNGGAIYNNKGTVTVKAGTFKNNVASSTGGAFYNNEGTFTIENGTYSENASQGGGGGVIVSSKGTVYIEGGSFSGNTASTGGGVVNTSSSAKIYISGGNFTGNTAGTNGGAVHISGSGKVYLTAGTIQGNFDQNDPKLDIWLNNATSSLLDMTGAGDLTLGNVGGKKGDANIVNPNGIVFTDKRA